jgi:hypothetical protein
MANKIEKKAVRFQATGNMAEEAAKIGKSIEDLSKSLDKMGKNAKEATGVAAQGVEEFQNSVKGFAKSLVTIEAIKAGLQMVAQYMGEAVKKFQEAEIAGGNSLDEISKNTTKLQGDLDKLQISVGRLVNALSEEALAGEENQKSFVNVLASLVEKASEASDTIIDMAKALALVNPITGPIILSFTVMGGLIEELTRKIDGMTGASKASVEELEKLAAASAKNVEKFRAAAAQRLPDVPVGGGGENEMLRKKAKAARPRTARRAAAASAPVGDFSGGFAEAEAEVAKNDSLKEQILLRERIAELKLADLDYEAEVASIMGKMDLTPKERELELQEAKIRQNEKELQQADEKLQKDEEEKNNIREKAQLHMTYVDAAQTGAEAIGNAIGMESEMKIAAAAIDGAQAAYLSLIEFGLGNFAGGATLAAASVQAFAMAGQSAFGGGGASSGKRKGGGTKPTAMRPGATAREAAASSTADKPSTTVYNVSFRSLSTPTAREARQIAQALDREGRSRV